MISRAIKVLAEILTETLSDNLGKPIEVYKTEQNQMQQDAFVITDKMITMVDFSGSMVGFLALSLDEKTAANFLDIEELPTDPEELISCRSDYQDLLQEVLNSCSGEAMEILRKQFPIITVMAPKVVYGTISFPKALYYHQKLFTNLGDFEFYIYLDSMELDINRLLNTIKEQENKLQSINRKLETSLERERAAHQEKISLFQIFHDDMAIPMKELVAILENSSLEKWNAHQNREAAIRASLMSRF